MSHVYFVHSDEAETISEIEKWCSLDPDKIKCVNWEYMIVAEIQMV